MKTIYKSLSIMLVAAMLPLTSCDDVELEKAATVETLPDVEDTYDGSIYDYTLTGKPERPYMHDYNACMLIKLCLAEPDRANDCSHVYMTYDKVLENIKAIDAITLGVKKIVYLVGWQFDGHDDRYPAIDVFNEALKRDEDATARDSYLWLRKEAARYNTVVSVHITIGDAYTNSPLWHEYVKNDLLCRDAAGLFISSGVLQGYPMYWVCTYNEWRKGLLQKRLGKLIEDCDLKAAGTVHFDAFFGNDSPYHDITREMQETVMRKVLRMMRDNGVDVTAEMYTLNRLDPMVGLQAAAWWNDLSAAQRAAIPRGLVGGGVSGQLANNVWSETGFLFGDNAHVEEVFYEDKGWGAMAKDFCLQTVPYLLYGRHEVEEYDAARRTVRYDGGLVANAADMTVRLDGVLIRDHNNLFMPAVWKADREIVAFSENGYGTRRWTLPRGWEDVTEVNVSRVSEGGLSDTETVAIVNGQLSLQMNRNEMLLIQAM